LFLLLAPNHNEARAANLRVRLKQTKRNRGGVSGEANNRVAIVDANNLALIVALTVALETSITDLHCFFFLLLAQRLGVRKDVQLLLPRCRGG
jgi:hypothetical protein